MFKKNDKRRLYWLLNQYTSGKITERIFCDEFYSSFDLEINYSTLTELEYKLFSELGLVAGRFSEYEEDHKLDPKAFYTTDQLKEKIVDTKKKLKGQRPE